MLASPPSSRASRRQPRWRKALVATCLGLVAALVLAELSLRFLVLHPGALAARLGANLRRIEHFGDLQSDEEPWKLQWVFLGERSEPNPASDPVVGWRGHVLPGYVHPQGANLERELGSKRLVLLFGDSYAQCTTPPSQCFQRLLAESDLGSRFHLLNFGVGGYGLDQIHLLIRHAVPNYARYDPLIVVGVFADDDLDRTVLGLRGWPKPRLRLREGELDYGGPVDADGRTYLERHPLEISSYLARLLAHRDGLLPESVQAALRQDDGRLDEKRELSRAILEAIAADLRGLELDFFVLSFQGLSLLRQPGEQWPQKLLREFARDEGVPLISTEPFLLAASGGDPVLARTLFGGAPRLAGHYNTEGNRVAFEALRQGLLGRFDPPDTSAVARTPDDAARRVVGTFERRARLLGRTCTITWSDEEACVVLGLPGATSHRDEGTFSARAGRRGATSVVWELGRRGSALRADARVVGGGARLTIALEGRAPLERVLAADRPAEPLEIALDGTRRLELRIEAAGGAAEPGWVVFERARFD